MSKNILLISPASFKEYTSTHTNTDDKLIRLELKAAQDIKIRELIGSLLYDKLLNLVENKTLTDVANTYYSELLYDYIIDALVNYTLAELPDATSYQFTNKGLIGKTGDGILSLDETVLKAVKAKYKNRGDFYAERTSKYLLANTAAHFPEYTRYGGIDTTPPTLKTYTSPIPLGVGRIEIKAQPGYNTNDPIIIR